MPGPITAMTRFAALAVLTAAMTLAPPLFYRSGNVAKAVTKKQCSERFNACNNRCAKRATEQYPKDANKQIDAQVSCGVRTCSKQHSNCMASASDGKKQASKESTRPSTGAPKHPLRPQNVTRQPGNVPTRPLTPQNITAAPGNRPMHSPRGMGR